MTLHRRQFLQLAAGAAAVPAFSQSAWAQAYPARPVQLIVSFPAGSAPDIIAPGNICRSASVSSS
jgi:tripartite-type tricarboxylate transporter receptor subunit TctC